MPQRQLARFRGTPARRPQINRPPESIGDILQLVVRIESLYKELSAGIDKVDQALLKFSQIKKGDPGRPGINGRDVHKEDVQSAVRSLLIQPKDGISPTAQEVAEALLVSPKFKKRLEKMRPKDAESVDTELLTEMIITEIQSRGISMQSIPGLESRFAEMRHRAATFGGQMRGGGDTVVAGSGVTITNTRNGNKEISVSGGGGPWLTPPETPNGVLTVFTVTAEPTDVVADGIQFFAGAGYTYAALQITFDNPPTQYVRYR